MGLTKSRHQEIIDGLVQGGALTRSFRQTLCDAVHKDVEPEYCSFREEWDFGVIPDAFRIIPEQRQVVIMEVEVTHHIPDEKLLAYHSLWWALDEYYWTMGLVTIDRFWLVKGLPISQITAYLNQDESPASVEPADLSWLTEWIGKSKELREKDAHDRRNSPRPSLPL